MLAVSARACLPEVVRARRMIMKVSEVFVIGVWRARGGILARGCARGRGRPGRARVGGRGVGGVGGVAGPVFAAGPGVPAGVSGRGGVVRVDRGRAWPAVGGGAVGQGSQRRSPMRARVRPMGPPRTRWTASTAAHRTSGLPCLVIRPRCTVVSDSRWRGVSPAQEHSCSARAKRCTSPISAVMPTGRLCRLGLPGGDRRRRVRVGGRHNGRVVERLMLPR
jgi:hypothetical protein